VVAALLLGACDREASTEKSAGESQAQPAAPKGEAQAGAGKATAERRPSLVFLGDSLTAGYGLGAEQAIPALIQAEVDRAGLGMRVINAGRSGDTTAGGKTRVAYYLRPAVAPAALVVWLGANDVMRGLPTAQIEANLRAILRRAREFDRDLDVFLVQMRAFPNLGADYAREFEAIYPRVAKDEGAELVPFPMAEVAGRPELNQPDGIHPTAEGTRKVATALWGALRPQLSSR
jgi:acyl-CoA thioesterase-1